MLRADPIGRGGPEGPLNAQGVLATALIALASAALPPGDLRDPHFTTSLVA